MPDDTDQIPVPDMILSGPSPQPPAAYGPRMNLSPEDQAALQSRLAYATGPGAPAWAQPKPAPQAPDELDPRMMQEAFTKLPIDQAVKAVGAAIRFQGLRGYQQDLANSVPADQALARHAPMMFWQAPGATMTSTMKAMTPPAKPHFVPATGGAPAYFETPGHPPTLLRAPPATPRPEDRMMPGVGLVRIDPTTGEHRVLIPDTRQSPMDPVQRALLGVDAADLRRTETEAAKAQGAVPTGIISKALHPFGGPQKAADALKKAAEAKRDELQQRYGRGSATRAPATAVGAPKRFRYDRATGKLVPLTAAATAQATATAPSLGSLAPPDDEEQDYPE